MPQLSAQLTLQKNGLAATSATSSTTPSKKKKFALGTAFEDEEEDETTMKYDAQCRRAVARMAVPRAALYTVAPEVLLGGAPTGESSLYCAGAVATQILAGKPLIKVSIDWCCCPLTFSFAVPARNGDSRALLCIFFIMYLHPTASDPPLHPPSQQNAAAEDKQVQYVYKTLGTPKPMDYADFDALPLAQYYGRHIVVSASVDYLCVY